jgi:hypothetical protein
MRRGSFGWWLTVGTGALLGAYAVSAGRTYASYGRPAAPRPEEADALLDEVMPDYEVVERHQTIVGAPADVTLAAACEMDITKTPLARAIFRTRAAVLGADPVERPGPRGLLHEVTALGWRMIAEAPGREIVMGAVTQPWQANVAFRGLSREDFMAFREPDHVKIAWTLRADPFDEDLSVFRTETRALATDDVARAKFRRYWSLVAPGVWLIRWSSLGPLRRDAERRARA